MPAQWPADQSCDVPSLEARGLRLRAGIVLNAERWSSTNVSGSVSGSVYQGTGGVSGSVSSRTIQHQRLYVLYPSTGREAALNLDDWQFDVRPGQAIVEVLPPERRRGHDHPVLVHNVSTGQVGPLDLLTTGRALRRFARAPQAALWLCRFIALALAFAPAAYIEFGRPDFVRRMKDGEVQFVQVATIAILLLFVTAPFSRAAKRAYLRGLGRRLSTALREPIAALGRAIPRTGAATSVA